MVTRSPLSLRQRARASSQERIISYTLIQVFVAASKSYPRMHPKYYITIIRTGRCRGDQLQQHLTNLGHKCDGCQ